MRNGVNHSGYHSCFVHPDLIRRTGTNIIKSNYPDKKYLPYKGHLAEWYEKEYYENSSKQFYSLNS